MAGNADPPLPPLLSSPKIPPKTQIFSSPSLSFPPTSATSTHGRSSQSQPPTQPPRRLGLASTVPAGFQERQAALVFPEMAVDRADKENLPPATAAVARPHGVVAVRSCKLKRLGRARRRVPLRDITNLIVAESAVAQWQQALHQQPREESAAAPAELAVKNGPAGGAPLKPGRFYSDYRFDVSKLEPVVANPHSPDNRDLARECKDVKIDRVYVGSCTGGKRTSLLLQRCS